MRNREILNHLLLGGFIVSFAAGLYFLLLLLFAVVYLQDESYGRDIGIIQALLAPGSGLLICAATAAACFIIPGRLGLHGE